MDLFERMLELSQQDFYCAQILLLLALESEDRENPELVRAMGGLNGGLGFSGRSCGAQTGGCCLISYFAGKGEAEELADPNLNAMLSEFVEWFETEYMGQYGGSTCSAILAGDSSNKIARCPGVVEAVWNKVTAILTDNGVLQ